MKCTNCSFEFEGNFCPECGQKAGKNSLSFAQMFTDIPGQLLLLEKRYYRTIVDYVKDPLQMVKAYARGKRKHYSHPIQFFYFFATVSLLIYKGMGSPHSNPDIDLSINSENVDDQEVVEFSRNIEEAYRQTIVLYENYSNFLDLLLPILFGFIMFLFYFRKLNLVECLTFSFFGLALSIELPSFIYPFISDSGIANGIGSSFLFLGMPYFLSHLGRRKWLQYVLGIIISLLTYIVYFLLVLSAILIYSFI